jgi:hypothetical protein
MTVTRPNDAWNILNSPRLLLVPMHDGYVRDKDEAHGTFCAPFSLQESSRPLVELLPLLT